MNAHSGENHCDLGTEHEQIVGIRALLASAVDQLRQIPTNLLTWGRVRALGEFQLLTKASYGMLVLVPILAGIWPPIRTVVNHHNQLLERAATKLEQRADSLEHKEAEFREKVWGSVEMLSRVPGVSTASIQQALDAFAVHVHGLATEVKDMPAQLRKAGALSQWLPESFALAYFAALAVAIGHGIYQAGAPPMVRRYSEIDYIRVKQEEYRDHPSEDDFQIALDKMRELYFNRLKDASRDWTGPQIPELDKIESASDFHTNALIDLHAFFAKDSFDTVEFREAMDYKRFLYPFDLLIIEQEVVNNIKLSETMNSDVAYHYRRVFNHEFKSRPSAEVIDTRKIGVIGDAAKYDYILESEKKAGYKALALLAYTTGGCILLWIAGKQSLSVMVAAGWVVD